MVQQAAGCGRHFPPPQKRLHNGTAMNYQFCSVAREGRLTIITIRRPEVLNALHSPAMQMGGLPLGLAHDVKVVRPVKKGQSLTWADVAMDQTTHAYRIRKEMEAMFASA
jgi:hypothetical protein